MEKKVTVAQLIEKLKTLPQDAEVEVLKEVVHGYDVTTEYAPIDLEWGLQCLDYTDERWKGRMLFGRKVIFVESV